jgi:PPM family protein phosphatase
VNNVSACGKTDAGLKRRSNEDSFVIELDYGLFIVADGMGGHTAGDMASSMAVKIVRDFIKKALSDSEITWPFGLDHSLPIEINAISSGIRLANKYIFNEPKDMGTTMVVLLIKDNKAVICHVGDSRLYRIRDNAIEQITEDHSLVADEIKKGTITKEQAKNYSLRHVITMAIGMNADIRCDCKVEGVRSEDMFLLCSDGLSGMLEDSEILNITTKENRIERCCERLIRMANEKGGDDNITAILVRCN